MCNCQGWARIPEQGTHGGKYPAPMHHPNCEDYRLEEFARVECDGSSCVMETHEAAAIATELDREYRMTPVMLTRDQYENLGEFAGF